MHQESTNIECGAAQKTVNSKVDIDGDKEDEDKERVSQHAKENVKTDA